MNADAFRRLALSLPQTSEAPHFDRRAFRTPRKIFATLAADGATANLMLTPEQQHLLVKASDAFEAVPNKWGAGGATTCTLSRVTVEGLRPVLAEAHAAALPAPKRPRFSRRRV